MWPAPEDSQELLRDAREGKQPALDDLLTRHRPALRRVIQLRLDPAVARRVDASDIVQDVLLEASRRLSDYDDTGVPFHIWLRRLALDRIIDMHRRHRVAQRRTVDKERHIDQPALDDRSSLQLAAQLMDGKLTPAAAAMQRELARRLGEALMELSDGDRDMIIMRHYEQLSNQEVAAALELTEPAAGMRYLRALRRLRAVLEKSGE